MEREKEAKKAEMARYEKEVEAAARLTAAEKERKAASRLKELERADKVEKSRKETERLLAKQQAEIDRNKVSRGLSHAGTAQRQVAAMKDSRLMACFDVCPVHRECLTTPLGLQDGL